MVGRSALVTLLCGVTPALATVDAWIEAGGTSITKQANQPMKRIKKIQIFWPSNLCAEIWLAGEGFCLYLCG